MCTHLGRNTGIRSGIQTYQCAHFGKPCTIEPNLFVLPSGPMPSCTGCEHKQDGPPLPKIDIVITSHNYGHFLHEALQSLADQSLAVIGRIIVVDDSSNSDDQTQLICNEFGIDYLRVEFHSPHLSRSAGLAHCSSPLVLFLDADNTIQTGYLLEASKLFAADPSLAIAYCDLADFGNSSELRIMGGDYAFLERRNFVDTGSVWKSEALRQSGVFRLLPKMAEDWRMAREILRSGGWSIAKNPVPLNYRRHDSQRINDPSRREYFASCGLSGEVVTIFTTYSGRVANDRSLWDRRKKWIQSQSWPRSQIRIAVANTSHQQSPTDLFVGLTGFAGLSVYDHPVGSGGLEDVCRYDRSVEDRVQTAVAAIYNRMLREVNSEFVLVLEDDVFPETLDAIEFLLRGFDENTAGVSGAYQQRYYPFGWTAFLVAGESPKLVPSKGTGVQKVAGTGFGCLMLRMSQVRDVVIAGNTSVSRYYDADWWPRITAKGLTVKVDWRVTCEHVGPRTQASDRNKLQITSRVEAAIQYADLGQSRLSQKALSVDGMSSPKVRHLLNNLSPRNYLEIGSWKGSTAVAATEGNLVRATCIDNWTGFGGPRDEFIKNTSSLPITLIDADASSISIDKIPEGVDVFFYDGDHSVDATKKTIARMMPRMKSEAVVIVDDTNYSGVANAGREGVKAGGFEILKEWNLPASKNGDLDQWWNGLLVMVVKRPEWDTSKPSRGLGDVVAKVTSAVGIKPCGGCGQRQTALNTLVPFRK